MLTPAIIDVVPAVCIVPIVPPSWRTIIDRSPAAAAFDDASRSRAARTSGRRSIDRAGVALGGGDADAGSDNGASSIATVGKGADPRESDRYAPSAARACARSA